MDPVKIVTTEQYEEVAPGRKKDQKIEVASQMDNFMATYGEKINELITRHERVDYPRIRAVCVKIMFGLASGLSQEAKRFISLEKGLTEEAFHGIAEDNVVRINDYVGKRRIRIVVLLKDP